MFVDNACRKELSQKDWREVTTSRSVKATAVDDAKNVIPFPLTLGRESVMQMFIFESISFARSATGIFHGDCTELLSLFAVFEPLSDSLWPHKKRASPEIDFSPFPGLLCSTDQGSR
jgi:hypothetical protein